jgi:hypothetical protein
MPRLLWYADSVDADAGPGRGGRSSQPLQGRVRCVRARTHDTRAYARATQRVSRRPSTPLLGSAAWARSIHPPTRRLDDILAPHGQCLQSALLYLVSCDAFGFTFRLRSGYHDIPAVNSSLRCLRLDAILDCLPRRAGGNGIPPSVERVCEVAATLKAPALSPRDVRIPVCVLEECKPLGCEHGTVRKMKKVRDRELVAGEVLGAR